MRHVGIITARGGSQRIPGKNIMPFCGRPLIVWSIIQTWAAGGVDKVYVSTDSTEIADVARDYKATIHMREDPHESDHAVSGWIPTVKVIEKYKLQDCAILPFLATSPLRQQKDIDTMVTLFKKYDGKYHIQGHIHEKDIFLCRNIGGNTVKHFLQYCADRSGSGDIPIEYVSNTGTFVMMVSARDYLAHVCTENTMTGLVNYDYWPDDEKYYVKFFLLEDWQRFDIDYPADAEIAEYFFEKKGLREYWNRKWEEIR